MKNKYYAELYKALGMNKNNYPEKKVIFFKTEYDKLDAISLVIKGIDNKYYGFGDPKYIFKWEVYLMSDGTWKIV
jgi:hypothetical protein